MSKTSKTITLVAMAVMIVGGVIFAISKSGSNNTSAEARIPSAINACQALTGAEVSDAIGQTYMVGEDDGYGNQPIGEPRIGSYVSESDCRYTRKADRSGRVSIRVTSPAEFAKGDYMQKRFEQARADAESPTTIPNLGTSAYSTDNGRSVSVLSNNSIYRILANDAVSASTMAKAAIKQ